jgi:hypothetical protein
MLESRAEIMVAVALWIGGVMFALGAAAVLLGIAS